VQGALARFCSPLKRAAAAQVGGVCALAVAWINIEAVMAVTAAKVLRMMTRMSNLMVGWLKDITMAAGERPFCEPVHTS